jgi:integrase
MSTRNKKGKYPERNKWWDIDLTTYDQSHHLTQVERAALIPFMRRRRRIASKLGESPYYCEDLRRLMAPLLDIARCSEVGVSDPVQVETWRRAFNLLMRKTYERQKTYWAWTKEEWVTILCESVHAFEKKYRLNANYRRHVMKIAYLIGKFSSFHLTGINRQCSFAKSIFGWRQVERAVEQIASQLARWGYQKNDHTMSRTASGISALLLMNRSPRLEDIKIDLLETLRKADKSHLFAYGLAGQIYSISRVLAALGSIPEGVTNDTKWNQPPRPDIATIGVSTEWASWSKRWRSTTTLQKRSADTAYSSILMAGRWLYKERPEITSPEQWSRELCADYVAVVNKSVVGQWLSGVQFNRVNEGQPLKPATKARLLSDLRRFFRDCQDWEWIPRRFNPVRALGTPRSISRLIGAAPRTIQDDIWAKLLWAGLNLTEADLPKGRNRSNQVRSYFYRPEMMRALSIVWLFSGSRNDEIVRLRVGCIRWLSESVPVIGEGGILSRDAICMLEIPANKTSIQFTKPVDRVVGEAIEAWERVRTETPMMLDPTTKEMVQFLFAQRAKSVGRTFINNTLIPILCRKAGVPESDAKGDITSHRARSTIATRLANCKDPMTLHELMEWLGHTSVQSTIRYVEVTPIKLGKAYQDADFFSHNVRTIQVLIDQDAIVSGAAAQGEPWRYYDLGDGLCTNEFFVTCPHRVACAKCAFYVPKKSAKALFLESKANLLMMRQEIPLTEDEIAAVDEGVEAMEKLCNKLADVPTPSGSTPRQMYSEEEAKPLIQITRLKRTGT